MKTEVNSLGYITIYAESDFEHMALGFLDPEKIYIEIGTSFQGDSSRNFISLNLNPAAKERPVSIAVDGRCSKHGLRVATTDGKCSRCFNAI